MGFVSVGQNTTELKGYIHHIDLDTLIVAKSYEDVRYSGVEIPVANGKEFTYTLPHKHIEQYVLVYKSELKKGAWKRIEFFPNGNTIIFELYPSNEFFKNKVTGDTLRQKRKEYLEVFAKKFSKKGNEIYQNLQQHKKGSKEFENARQQLNSFHKKILSFQHQYFVEDRSILGLHEYVFLLKNAAQMMISPEILKDYQAYYTRTKPNHPLTERAMHLYSALTSVKVRQPYIDITLFDENNRETQLANVLTKEKFTIIDLWSPWCAPCIQKSSILKENYAKLSNHAQIISVVGGVDTKVKAEKAIATYNYPWKSYVEISNQNKIWEKYGIANAGGAQFLIDTQGKIVAINPSIEELLKIVTAN